MVFGLFKKISQGLGKTREKLSSAVRALLAGRQLDDSVLQELEEILLRSDMGVETVEEVLARLREAYRKKEIADAGAVVDFLKRDLAGRLEGEAAAIRLQIGAPTVILVTGVNGSGKTTSIAKLARHFKDDGKKVLLVAADTFRAAAVQQLAVWAERLGVEIIRHQMGSDPAAVAFDGIDAAVARKVDVVIIDTAGRLHTQVNLMNELEKIRRVIGKKIPGAPHEVLIVIDATTGQNGLQQARQFSKSAPVTGVILTKLDGTAKGGIIFAIRRELNIPVKFVGTGEQLEDLAPFDPGQYASALFD